MFNLTRSLSPRLVQGAIVPRRVLESIAGEQVRIPDPSELVHLQFRRFAGCPVCDLHLREVVRRHAEIVGAGVREVVVFHSTVAESLEYESHLPFAVIADPEKRLYREFGVEAAARALLDPRAWPIIARGIAQSLARLVRRGGPIPPLIPGGGSLGLPADFLIEPDGKLIAAKYGGHAGDHWSVDELLAVAGAARRSESGLSADAQTQTVSPGGGNSELAARHAGHAFAVLALTSVHHVYGAFRYQTPFRLHVVLIAAAVAGLIVAAERLFLRRQSLPRLLALASGTLIFPVAGIGIFEGSYNHVAKNALYFAGVSRDHMLRLFPPPKYELPNDFWFELSGVLQVVPAAMAAYSFSLLYRRWQGSWRKRCVREDEPPRAPSAE